MRYLIPLLLAGALTLAPIIPSHADDAPAPAKSDTSKKHATDDAAAPSTESAVRTQHSASIGGHSIKYTATAGTLIIRDDKGQPQASVFYVAYTLDGSKAEKRPVTFLYNGGPGSSSVWLHMGSFAPVRIETASPEATAPAPYHLVPNNDSLLDKTDLVFIDAVGTGYSAPAGQGHRQGFLGRRPGHLRVQPRHPAAT